MFEKIWRPVTIMLTSLSLWTVLCHLLEMQAKISYSSALWAVLQIVALGALVVSILVEIPSNGWKVRST